LVHKWDVGFDKGIHQAIQHLVWPQFLLGGAQWLKQRHRDAMDRQKKIAANEQDDVAAAKPAGIIET
jgi:hypothetical protein